MIYFLWINLIVVLCIILLVLSSVIRERLNFEKHIFRFFIIIFFNLLMFLTILSWVTGYFKYSSVDFAYVYSLVLFFEVISLSVFFSKVSFQNCIFYIVCGLSFSMLIFGVGSIFLVTSLVFLYLLTLSLNSFSVGEFRNASLIGLVFSSLGIIFELILFINKELVIYFVAILNIFYLIYLFVFFKERSLSMFKEKRNSLRNPVVDLIRYFIFIIIITNLVLIATLSIHEVGHFMFSWLYGCTGQRIIFEAGSLHTDVLCNGVKNVFLIAGGIIIPIIISILLFLSGGKSLKGVALLIFGFDLMASYMDLQEAGMSELIALVMSIVGIAVVCVGIFLLIKARIDEHMLHLSNEEKINSNGGYF